MKYVNSLHSEIDFDAPESLERRISEKLKKYAFDLQARREDDDELRRCFHTSIVLYDFMNHLLGMDFRVERENFKEVMCALP